MFKITLISVLFFLFTACTHTKTEKDAYLWLEDVESPKALNWAKKQSDKTLNLLAKSGDFKKIERDSLKILEATDKIPGVSIQGSYLYNFWRDAKHVRGIVRRTSYKSYKNKSVRWETVLDIDKLSKKENENWVYKGRMCLEPEYRHCLIELSRGGKDAVVIREFDMKAKAFVKKGGFNVPEAKTFLSWADKNHIMIGTDYGKGSLTDSGYPRLVKVWKRGSPLSSAKTVFEGKTSDVAVSGSRFQHQKVHTLIVSRSMDFFNSEEFSLDLKTMKTQKFPKPGGAQIEGYFKGYFIYLLRNPWSFSGKKYAAGDLVAFHSSAAGRKLVDKDVQLIFSPNEKQSFKSIAILKDRVALSVLDDVRGKVFYTAIEGGKWQVPLALKLPSKGDIKVASSTDTKDFFLYYYESYNQPSALYSYEFGKRSQLLKTLPPRFNAKNIIVRQNFSTSKDGTKVPYFIVHKKGIKLTSKNPTLLYGYGGFAISLTPRYQALVGKHWLEKGGVYVVANIRGGGEYGPNWHQAALKENRQRAYDDFISVAEDLIATKVTQPKHLAIRGGSNGGLLVGAVMTQRPELFGAVLCWVPLLDMIRYSQLLAGASWIGEYGDPKEEKYRRVIMKYSPYQNVGKNKKYPPLLMVTSTKDDRVHPGHARKMTAKMMSLGYDVSYYENMEGGHAANANFKQKARLSALEFSFLNKTILSK